MRLGPLPRRRPRPPAAFTPLTVPGPGGCGPEAGPRGGVALPVTSARGEGRGGDSVRAAGAGTAGEAQTLLGVFGTWKQSPLGGAARPPGNAGELPVSLKTRPGPNGPRDSSLRDHGTQRLTEPAPQPLTLFVPAPQRGISMARNRTGNHSSQSTCQPHFDSPIKMKRRRGDRE
uniref:uncharacterized protein LOC114673479 n=1 Tax=Macaca mulatta TaxID=9544 RepID=UPI0010A21AEB|nr:uncharacterized protein LOC114673479 [Macaca mulatta]